MKKLSIFTIIISLVLLTLFIPKAHAYTLTNARDTYYNQVTSSVGESDILDIGNTYYERMYFNLGYSFIHSGGTIRFVFSSTITTEQLPLFTTETQLITITISFYNISNVLIYSNDSYYNSYRSLSYYENNFNYDGVSQIDYITITFDNLPIGYDEETMHLITNNAIIVRGNDTVINQTINSLSYNNGWADAMNSKVTQIWSLWGNIFDTFMGVFDIFSIQLVGDITIGHLAMVPLVLGLIGFIYALGGKRGR